MEILTKRFLLRDFVPQDESAFQSYHADRRYLEFHGADESKPGHATELLSLFRKWAGEQPRRNYQLAIVRHGEPETLIGCCGLRTADSERGNAELGIEMDPAYWGRYGYAIEIIHALVEFGFRDLELRQIYGRTVSANTRIGRLVSSFGAVAVKLHTPEWMAARGWSQIEWRVTRDQWNGRLILNSNKRRADASR